MRDLSAFSNPNDYSKFFYCLEISLENNSYIRLSSADEDITFEGNLYKAADSFGLSSSEEEVSSTKSNLGLIGIIEDQQISATRINNGVFDNAIIEIFILEKDNLEASKITISKGYLSDLQIDGDSFTFDIKPISSRLKTNIINIYSPTCRAKLGDSKCAKDLTSYRSTGSVSEVDTSNPRLKFSDDSRAESAGYYNYGTIKFTSGDNIGKKFEIKKYKTPEIELLLPTYEEIKIGDEYEITAGCDKRFSSCVDKFDNAINFRGEPHIPGNEKILDPSN
jgi:uncharacterized phage protein (TIGR02218 family)